MKKTAIVTGGAKGIGAGISKVLALNGFNICLGYFSDTLNAEKTALVCRNLGAEVILVKGDISNLEVCQNMIEATIAHFKGIDVLVNNAATTKFCGLKNLNQLSKTEFLHILDVNMVSNYFLVSLAEDYLRKSPNNPCIINISSTAGRTGIGSSMAYSVSKGALNTLTIALAKILAPVVRVNSVEVGFVDTEWWLKHFDVSRYEIFKDKQKDKSALNKITSIEDVADSVLFLIRNTSLTGEIITIDSGIAMGKI